MPPVTGERICAKRLYNALNDLKFDTTWRVNNNLVHTKSYKIVWYFAGAGRIGFIRDLVSIFIIRQRNKRIFINIHNTSWRRFKKFASLIKPAIGNDSVFAVLSDKVKEALCDEGFESLRFDNYVTPPLTVAKPNKTKRLIWLSAVNREKGFHKALEVFKQLRRVDSNWLFDIYGPCDAEIIINTDGASYYGSIDNSDIEQVFSKGGILILPSDYTNENQPLVILEAFSHGIPVVVSAVGGLPEMVGQGKDASGFSIEAFSPQEYVRKTVQIYENYEVFSSNARDTFNKKYSEEAFLDALRSILESKRI